MLTADEWPGNVTLVSYARECVAELLRQYAENETLRAGYAAARLEIESLKAQLHAAKQINAAQFGLLAASIPGSALRASHWQAPAETGNSVSAQTDSVQEDAARYRWLRRWKGQEHEPPFTVQHEIDGALWGGDLDAAIDADRKQGTNHDR